MPFFAGRSVGGERVAEPTPPATGLPFEVSLADCVGSGKGFRRLSTHARPSQAEVHPSQPTDITGLSSDGAAFSFSRWQCSRGWASETPLDHGGGALVVAGQESAVKPQQPRKARDSQRWLVISARRPASLPVTC